MFWFNFILDLNSISLLFLGMVTYMYDNEFEINKNKIYTNYWTTTCMSFTLLRDLSRNPQDSTLELFCSLVWDFKPILPQGSRMFLINSKVSPMRWHIFRHWQRLLIFVITDIYLILIMCDFSPLKNLALGWYVFTTGGYGWLWSPGYSKRLNLCHKPLPSVLWAYVMSMWYVQK